jgi:hypothetical protein
VDKGDHELFAGPDPFIISEPPAPAVDDLDHKQERPQQKSGKPRSGNDQACDASTVHSKQVMAR